jgi:ankyrin repeat protein
MLLLFRRFHLILLCVVVLSSATSTGADDEKSLFAAISRGDASRVSTIIASHPEYLKLRTRIGMSPLHYAAQDADSKVLKTLLRHTDDVNLCDNDGMTPLHYAARFNRKESVELLLKHGAEVDYCGFENQGTSKERALTPLCKAASLGAVETAEILIGAGAAVGMKVDASNTYRMGPVHSACITILSERELEKAGNSGNRKILSLLKESGAKLDEQNRNGFTPLYYAVDLLRPDIVKELVRLGADVSAKTRHGATALHVLAAKDFKRFEDSKEARGRAQRIIQILIAAGAKREAVDAEGRSVLEIASVHKNGLSFEEERKSTD